jgi:hypothetical protein
MQKWEQKVRDESILALCERNAVFMNRLFLAVFKPINRFWTDFRSLVTQNPKKLFCADAI